MSRGLPERPSARDGRSSNVIRAFVHLARGFGASNWRARWERGEIIGFNQRLPYGFFWAQQDGCTVEYSEDCDEGPLGAAWRLVVRLLLGFDLVHAWRNRRGIYAAEIVWTGTESQYLAVLLLLRFRRERRPKVIAQSVWFFDTWPRLWVLKRWLYRWLIADAAVLTVHSEAGLRPARALFPRQRVMFMPFGIGDDSTIWSPPHRAHAPIRVLSVGNDRHRDWATLVTAIRGWPNAELCIVAPRLPARLKLGGNIRLVHPATNDEYFELYRWADVVALPLRPNLHGSGITVIEEATIFGLPVVVTDAGGLRSYFSDQEMRYVPGSDPDAMREAIAAIAEDETSSEMVKRAQRRMIEDKLTSPGFAFRHAALSRELLGKGNSRIDAHSVHERTNVAARPRVAAARRRALDFDH